MVGVNDFVSEEKPLETLQIDESVAHRQAERLSKLRAGRSHVAPHNPQSVAVTFLQPLNIIFGSGAREIVEDCHIFLVCQIVVGKVYADKTSTAGYQITIFHLSFFSAIAVLPLVCRYSAIIASAICV